MYHRSACRSQVRTSGQEQCCNEPMSQAVRDLQGRSSVYCRIDIGAFQNQKFYDTRVVTSAGSVQSSTMVLIQHVHVYVHGQQQSYDRVVASRRCEVERWHAKHPDVDVCASVQEPFDVCC